MRVESVTTAELSAGQLAEVRALCDAAFAAAGESFGDDDWRSSLGGVHFMLADGNAIVSHGSVVERLLELDGRPLRTGYVEAVATLPERQGEGLGTLVIREITAFIDRTYDLGALSGDAALYERMGWQPWLGRTGVRAPDGLRLTPEEDGGVLLRGSREVLDAGIDSLLTCDWRPGDVW